MWVLKENKNSNGETEECFRKPSKGSFTEFGQQVVLLFSVVSPKSYFKIEQPSQKFLCTWAIIHPPQEPGPGGKGSQISSATLPWPGTCRQTHHLLTLPTAQRRKRTSGKPCCSKGWWHWHRCGTRSTVRLQKSSLQLPHHPHSAHVSLCCQLSSMAHEERALLFLHTSAAKTWEEEAGQCNYGKIMFKKPISSANEIGFFAVVVSLVRTGDGMNLVCSSKSEGQRRKKHQVCFWGGSPGLQVLRSQLGMLVQPWCLVPETLIYPPTKHSFVFLPKYKLQAWGPCFVKKSRRVMSWFVWI